MLHSHPSSSYSHSTNQKERIHSQTLSVSRTPLQEPLSIPIPLLGVHGTLLDLITILIRNSSKQSSSWIPWSCSSFYSTLSLPLWETHLVEYKRPSSNSIWRRKHPSSVKMRFWSAENVNLKMWNTSLWSSQRELILTEVVGLGKDPLGRLRPCLRKVQWSISNI